MKEQRYFNVIRLDRGPKKGQVWVIPSCRPSGYRMMNGRETSRPQLKAQLLLANVPYDSAYWYARGLLQGEAGKLSSPYILPGNSKYWDVRILNG